MLANTEASGAVGESGAEDGDTAFVAGLDEAVFLDGTAVVEPFAEFVDKLARAVRTGFEHVGQFVGGVVTSLKFLFVDKGVVDTVDIKFAEFGVGDDVLFGADIVFEAEGFEEVHVDDGGAGGDDHVDHFVANHVDIDLHAACRTGGAGDGENVGAVFLFAHHGEDIGGTGSVAAGEGHAAHGVDELGGVVFLNVDVFDGLFEEIFLGQIVDVFHC